MELNWNPPDITDRKATFIWGAEHAEQTHNGEPSLTGFKDRDRPWTEVVIAETNLEELFAEKYDGDINTAFEATAEELGDRFKETIEHHQWDIKSTGKKRHKDAPNWETIDDSGELKRSQSLEFE
ncbi:hypothetical protein IQ268_08515 [Oculatella sp. LEGE 06141]|uniref:hypothetical protein n=1 Tax=Oculatella sp. LEGE 06141 TaxID=1828648 RepID=UPI0018809393|nr:hypothetical protein [Oculatella sp. LEGE 06141]MBE9178600.1 hypothetical protein [Oculatella sp. LEGE 06141]